MACASHQSVNRTWDKARICYVLHTAAEDRLESSKDFCIAMACELLRRGTILQEFDAKRAGIAQDIPQDMC